MNFKYQAVSEKGEKKNGIVEAINKDAAITALQRRGLVVVTLALPHDVTILTPNLYYMDPHQCLLLG